MMLAVLLATVTPSVIAAEQTLAGSARTRGQWTALRATAASDARLFVPEPVAAQTWLKDRADPPVAVAWQPSAAWTSCDGWLAATTGNWQRGHGVGYFSTIWSIANPSRPVWKWQLDHGDDLATARAAVAKPATRRAACSTPVGAPTWPPLPDPDAAGRGAAGGGASGDKTLQYRWYVTPDQARSLSVAVWNGTGFDIVLTDMVAAPKIPAPRDKS